MTDDTHPDLFGLLRGELANAEVMAAGDHLQTCATCHGELVGLTVGNALVSRAARTFKEPHPIAGITAVTTASVPGPGDLPPLTALSAPHRRRVPRPALVAAAVAAAVVIGGSVAAVVTSRSDDASLPPAVTAQATLQAVTGSGAGEVRMTPEDARHSRMTIETHDLPPAGRGEYYYAWLLDESTDKMLPLGQVGPGGSATFELDDALIGRYASVDVSLESDDGDPGHSVTSVLRGSYGATTATPPASIS